jgi:hypothetical protein
VDYTSISYSDAVNRSLPEHFVGTGIPYRGKVYSKNDYGFGLFSWQLGDKLHSARHCAFVGCYNPHERGSEFCEYHICQEPNCRTSINHPCEYNCGFCSEHMESHGIDRSRLRREGNALAATGGQKTAGSSASGNGSHSTKPTGGSAANSSSSSGSWGESGGNKSTYQDSYDDGYEDVYLDEDYDWNRYRRDSDYAAGVDDALDDEDWDW